MWDMAPTLAVVNNPFAGGTTGTKSQAATPAPAPEKVILPKEIRAFGITFHPTEQNRWRSEYVLKAQAYVKSVPTPTAADVWRAAKGDLKAQAKIAKKKEVEVEFRKLLKFEVQNEKREALSKDVMKGPSGWQILRLSQLGGSEQPTYFDAFVYDADSMPLSPAAQAAEQDKYDAEARVGSSMCERLPQYQEGAPKRPNIGHDHGARQDPKNPELLLPTVKPTKQDRVKFAEWKVVELGAKAAEHTPMSRHLPDALGAYQWFRTGKGKDRTIDYERFIKGDPAGKRTLEDFRSDYELLAQKKYLELVKADPKKAKQTVVFQVTSGAFSAESPETENWLKALGEHPVWTSGTITVIPPANGKGAPSFKMSADLHMEDRYNFNPGSADVETGLPDNANARFELTGMANEYMNYGTAHHEWTFAPKKVELPTIDCDTFGNLWDEEGA